MGALVEFLQQTLSPYFKVGVGSNGITVNANSGVAEMKNNANDSLVNLNVADPTASTHAATKGWAEANLGVADAVRETKLTFDHTDLADTGTVTLDTSDLPTGAVIKSIDLDVGTGFDAGASVLMGTSADDDAFVASGEFDLTFTGGPQSKNFRSAAFGSAAPVKLKITTTGTPSAGSGTAFVTYSVPSAPA